MSSEDVEPISLGELSAAETRCTGCPLHRSATQVVPGEGRPNARLMLVGEQPGDREDLAGRPFVGPAGRVLDDALVEAGVPREAVFVTNAVKHFKFEARGRRRLHRRPNAHEIERCRWWLDQERRLVRPHAVVALGATAVRALLRRPASVSSLREAAGTLEDGTPIVATIHPSYLLRLRDPDRRERERTAFVADLRRAWCEVAA
jgi:DNA polymerase